MSKCGCGSKGTEVKVLKPGEYACDSCNQDNSQKVPNSNYCNKKDVIVVPKAHCEKETPVPCGSMRHTAPVIQKEFRTYLTSSGRVLMPDVDGTNFIKLPEVDKILEGTVLYSYDVGYLLVLEWDTTNKLATFRNAEEYRDQQVLKPGDWISDCTEWLITAPSAGIDDSRLDDSSCYLESDFIVPDVDDTVVVSFTKTDCFQTGDTIRIDGVALKVVDVLSSSLAELGNIESATDALKKIVAKDCDTLLHKVIVIGEENPCDVDIEAAPALLAIANEETCQKGIIKTTLPNQYLGTDETGKWIVKEFPVEDIQTTFTGCLLLNPALDPQEYLLVVSSPQRFNQYDEVEFNCDEAVPKRKFTIKTIAGNNFTLVPNFDVNAVESIASDCDDCTLVQVSSCSCSLKFAPEYKKGSFWVIHNNVTGFGNVDPIFLDFTANGGDYDYVRYSVKDVTTAMGLASVTGAGLAVQYKNDNSYPVNLQLELRIKRCHLGLGEVANKNNNSPTIKAMSDEIISRLVWAVIDKKDPDNPVASIGGTLEYAQQDGNHPADPATSNKGDWMNTLNKTPPAIAGMSFGLLAPYGRFDKVLQPGEDIDWAFRELFAFQRKWRSDLVSCYQDISNNSIKYTRYRISESVDLWFNADGERITQPANREPCTATDGPRSMIVQAQMMYELEWFVKAEYVRTV